MIDFVNIAFAPNSIVECGDSLKEDLLRGKMLENEAFDSKSAWKADYPTAVNWEVPTSTKEPPNQSQYKDLNEFWDEFIASYHKIKVEGKINVKQNVRGERRNDTLLLLIKSKDLIRQNPQKESQLLRVLEEKIERSSMLFDEESILNHSGILIRKIIKGRYLDTRSVSIYEGDDVGPPKLHNANIDIDQNRNEYTNEEFIKIPNAKEYVKSRLMLQEDLDIINHLGQYTLECVIVYVLGTLCNNPLNERDHKVRLASMIDKLDNTVRSHVEILMKRYSVPDTMNLVDLEDSESKETPDYESEATPDYECKATLKEETEMVKRFIKFCGGEKNCISMLENEKNKQNVEISEKEITHSTKVKKSSSKKKAASSLKKKNDSDSKKNDSKNKVSNTMYNIGVALMEFLLAKGLVKITNEAAEDHTGHIMIKTKKGKYYKPMPLYVSLTFEQQLLPIKLSLPMVIPPVKWHCVFKQEDDKKVPVTLKQPLNYIRGGYLCNISQGIVEGARLLSTPNSNFYDIRFRGIYKAFNMCDIMNTLQSVPFKINTPWLKTIKDDYDLLVKAGLLMPKALHSMTVSSGCDILRDTYLKNEKIQKLYKYSDLLAALTNNIQRARYEAFIIDLAEALDGYKIYFPVFLDFRGRIYRAGIANFHDRDLSRSLLHFETNNKEEVTKEERNTICISTAFHLAKFQSYEEASYWYSKFTEFMMNKKVEYLYMHSRWGRRPFQYLANRVILNDNHWKDWLPSIPITHDASASAYQIMSYLLLDEKMAENTNLISLNNSERIHDIYDLMLCQIKSYAKNDTELDLSDNLINILDKKLDRSIVKSVFMPKIYGKTVKSTASSINEKLESFITFGESIKIAKLCFQFWRDKYSYMENLILLIKNISWLAASADIPVWFNTEYMYTLQDYICMENNDIWVHFYDKEKKKKTKKKVTMKIMSNKRDRRKTVTSTFVNFIHQKDAYIAMKLVKKVSDLGTNTPIYTVHDNFITTAKYSHKLPELYGKIFLEMDHPLKIINSFIYDNLIYYVSTDEKLNKEYAHISSGNKIRFDLIDQKYPYYSQVMLLDFLEVYATTRFPNKGSKRLQEERIAKVKDILKRYNEYVESVYLAKGLHNCTKEEYFKHKLLNRMLSEPYYCLHH